MRNIYDQYEAPEDRLTHALASTLNHDRTLIKPFLSQLLKVDHIPSVNNIVINTQSIPDTKTTSESKYKSRCSRPDINIYDKDNKWAIALESKVQSDIDKNQLKRHEKTLSHNKYEKSYLFVIAVKRPQNHITSKAKVVLWKDIYKWFWEQSKDSKWARYFTEYMQVFEEKMVSKEYKIDGSLTMFSGFHFTDDYPYSSKEGRRLIKIICEELKNNKLLLRHYKLLKDESQRTKKQEDTEESVWGSFPLGKNMEGFILTIVLSKEHVAVDITVSNQKMQKIKSVLERKDPKSFKQLLVEIEKKLNKTLHGINEAVPFLVLTTPRYQCQHFKAHDGYIKVDLRVIKETDNEVRNQPAWIDSIYNIITNKQNNVNMRMGIGVRLPFKSRKMQTGEALNVMVNVWVTLKPFLGIAELPTT